MPPKRTSTSAAPAMTQDAIRQLVADSVVVALEVQAANMANTDNTNKNTGTSRTRVARKGTNDHKRKFVDRRNTTTNNDNNYSNNRNNNNYRDNHNNHNLSDLQQGGSSDQELQKQRTSHRKQHAINFYNLSCLWRERALQDNSTFHFSKKYLCDESLVIPIKEIWLDDKLNFMEEPVEIMDREVNQLRQRRIPIVKVRWNSEFTWEHEDQIHAKYPHLFSNTTSSSN
ncbi:hypothetical protein Tco_0798922 [Tanacetum coccineum]